MHWFGECILRLITAVILNAKHDTYFMQPVGGEQVGEDVFETRLELMCIKGQLFMNFTVTIGLVVQNV
uniref:Secreted protein n=1 Tax=Romanomermis culicivorax TaxID=13658 RepID=A0A915HRC3_ROMCU